MQVLEADKLQTATISHKSPGNTLFQLFQARPEKHFLAACGLILLLALFRVKSLLTLNSHFLGSVDGDAGLYLWLLKTNPGDLLNNPWFDKAAFYPYAKVLAWSDNFILPSLICWPFFQFGLSDPMIFNVLLLSAGFLNGYCTYRFCFLISGEGFASFFSGAVFMTLPYLTHQLGHPQLQFFFFIPLTLTALIHFLNQPDILKACRVGLFVFLTFLTTIYYAYFLTLACPALLIAIYCLRPSYLNRRIIINFSIGVLFAFLLILPFLPPYIQVKEAFSARGMYEAYYFAAGFWSYLSSTPFNLFYEATSTLSHSEAHLFSGFTVLLLAFLGINRLTESKTLKPKLSFFLLLCALFAICFIVNAGALSRIGCSLIIWLILFQLLYLMRSLGLLERKLNFSVLTGRDISLIFTFLALLFFAISLGPLANPEKGQITFAPFSLLYSAIPGFSAIRAISRSGLVALFALSIVAGLYLSHLFKKRAWRGVSILVFCFAILENYNTDFVTSALAKAPDNFSNLSSLASPLESAAILPMAGSLDRNNEVISWSEYAKLNMTYLLWSVGHNYKLLNGYSGQKTKIMREFPRELKDFPSQRAINALSHIADLNYIIFVSQFSKDFKKEEFEKKIKDFPSQLTLLKRDEQGAYLFALKADLADLDKEMLLLPASARSVSLKIRSAFKMESDWLEINVLLPEPKGEVAIGTLSIKPDGTWQETFLKIPESGNSVKPLGILLRTTNEIKLLVKVIGVDHG